MNNNNALRIPSPLLLDGQSLGAAQQSVFAEQRECPASTFDLLQLEAGRLSSMELSLRPGFSSLECHT
jgi:hypothetical protein